jgi:Tfp pilus assembly protein PilN
MFNSETATAIVTLPLIDLNGDRREERRLILSRSRRHAAAIAALFVTACVVLVPLTLQAVTLRHELGKAEVQAQEARKRLQSMTDSSALMDSRIGLWERLRQTQQSRQAWGAAFPSLAACLPQDVFLDQVQITGKDSDIEIQLQGSAGTMTGLRAFTKALAASPTFSRVHLDDAELNHDLGRSSLTFRVTGPMTTGAASISS